MHPDLGPTGGGISDQQRQSPTVQPIRAIFACSGLCCVLVSNRVKHSHCHGSIKYQGQEPWFCILLFQVMRDSELGSVILIANIAGNQQTISALKQLVERISVIWCFSTENPMWIKIFWVSNFWGVQHVQGNFFLLSLGLKS